MNKALSKLKQITFSLHVYGLCKLHSIFLTIPKPSKLSSARLRPSLVSMIFKIELDIRCFVFARNIRDTLTKVVSAGAIWLCVDCC